MITLGILGANGMLGSALVGEARIHKDIVVSSFKSQFQLPGLKVFIDRKFDVIINAAGAIPAKYGVTDMIMTNAYWPNRLAAECAYIDTHFIHVSTDHVFNGRSQSIYYPETPPDAEDAYGRSKALGEETAKDDGTVVRTSFVGFKHGLLRWVIDHRDGTKQLDGWDNVLWSGSSVYEVARGLLSLATQPPQGIVHMSARLPITKYNAVCGLRDAISAPITVLPVAEPRLSYALRPTPGFELRGLLHGDVLSELQNLYTERIIQHIGDPVLVP